MMSASLMRPSHRRYAQSAGSGLVCCICTHLHNGQQRIQAVQVRALRRDGDADDGQRCRGRDHARQVRGAPRPRDDDLKLPSVPM